MIFNLKMQNKLIYFVEKCNVLHQLLQNMFEYEYFDEYKLFFLPNIGHSWNIRITCSDCSVVMQMNTSAAMSVHIVVDP